METEKILKEETDKWLSRLKSKEVNSLGKKGDMIKENIEAYTEDTEHFLEKEDLVRAFEAVVWAWSWLEIGEELGKVERSE